MHVHAVMGEQGLHEGVELVPLWGPRVEDQCGKGVIAYLQHLNRVKVQSCVGSVITARNISLVAKPGEFPWKK